MSNPIISVIIPVYNVERYIKKCVDSVISQTFNCFQIIIINDCSTDNSEQIILEYKKKDKRIVYIKNKKNLGLGGSRNEGLKNCKSDYILFLDSDDWLDKNAIQILVNEIKNNDDDIDIFVFGMYKYFERSMKRKIMYQPELAILSSKREIGEKFFNPFFNPFLISSCNKVFKKKLFDKKENLFPDSAFYEDLYTTYKLILNSKKIMILPYIFYNYLLRSGSITKDITTKHINDIFNASEQIQKFISENYPELSRLLPKFFLHHVIISTLDKVLLVNRNNKTIFEAIQNKMYKIKLNYLKENEKKIIKKIESAKSINEIKWITIKSLLLKKKKLFQKINFILSRAILYKLPILYKFYISR